MGCNTKREEYTYAPDYQGGGQYGNLTAVREYQNASTSTPYRTTVRTYFPNEEDWIVDRLASEILVAGDWTGNLEAASYTWYSYDGADSHRTAPTTGELTRVQRLFSTDWDGEDGELPASWYTSEQTFGYDAWGNQTSATTYTDYGEVSQDEYGAVTREAIPQAGRTITTTYDAVHHSFPLTVTNPLGLQTAYRYYGVDGVAVVSGGEPGLLKSVTDVGNQDTTTHAYDVFGRPTHTWLPGDGEDASTILAYDDGARRLHTRRRDDPAQDAGLRSGSGSATYLESWQFYDGLGRPLQSQAEGGQGGPDHPDQPHLRCLRPALQGEPAPGRDGDRRDLPDARLERAPQHPQL
jgi:hypothetical protein